MSKDLLRRTKHKTKAQRQEEVIAAALEAGQSVVVDNTNPTVEERAPLILLGHRHGATVTGYYFASGVGASLERNQGREGKARVPDIAIFATANRNIRRAYPPARRF